MPTNDGSNPDQNLPLFLADELLADEPAQQSSGKTRHRPVAWSAVLGASVWIIAATALLGALLSEGVPGRVLAYLTASIADVTASLASKPSLQPGPDRSAPAIQDAPDVRETANLQDTADVRDTADVQALPPTASGAPALQEIAAGPKPAGQGQTENNESHESLISQFEAWAAEREARAKLEPAQPVQDTPASVQGAQARTVLAAPAEAAKDEQASRRHVQKRRYVRASREARAEMRSAHGRRKKAGRAPVDDPPVRDAQAQAQVEPVQPPSFLQSLGFGTSPPRP